jgi:hypothetical protein
MQWGSVCYCMKSKRCVVHQMARHWWKHYGSVSLICKSCWSCVIRFINTHVDSRMTMIGLPWCLLRLRSAHTYFFAVRARAGQESSD